MTRSVSMTDDNMFAMYAMFYGLPAAMKWWKRVAVVSPLMLTGCVFEPMTADEIETAEIVCFSNGLAAKRVEPRGKVWAVKCVEGMR